MLLGHLYEKLIEKPYPRIDLRNNPFFPVIKTFSVEMYRAAFEYSQYIPETKMKEIQERRIMALVLRAKETIPFYKNYLKNVNNIQDFKALPPISKGQMRKEFENATCFAPSLDAFKIPQYTSGSTGIPFYFYSDANMLARRVAIYRRMLGWIKKSESDLVVVLMPKVYPWIESKNTSTLNRWIDGEVIHIPCVDPWQLNKNIENLYRAFEGQSIILQSRASHLVRLAQCLERDGKNLKFKALISYTEQLFPEVRSYLGKVFNAPVFNYYGCNEINELAQECEIHEGFHINSEWVYIEIVDKNNNPLPPNETGDIIITSLFNEVMPIIKYRIGDIGRWISGKCPCGRTLPRIHIEGREISSFLRPNGEIAHFGSLVWPIIKIANKVFHYQIIRYSKIKYLIKVVPAELFKDSDKKFILDEFQKYLGPGTFIDFKIVQKIETANGKQRSFINLAPDYL